MVDYVTLGETTLWSLFNGRPFLASKFKAKNQLSFVGGKPFPEKMSRAPADYPEAKLRSPSGSFSGLTGQNAAKTFGNATAGGTSDFIVEETVNYEWTLTYDGVDEVLPNQVYKELIVALMTAGVNLGQSKIKTWGAVSHRTEQRKDATRNGTLGTIQTIIVPVVFRLHRADIIDT